MALSWIYGDWIVRLERKLAIVMQFQLLQLADIKQGKRKGLHSDHEPIPSRMLKGLNVLMRNRNCVTMLCSEKSIYDGTYFLRNSCQQINRYPSNQSAPCVATKWAKWVSQMPRLTWQWARSTTVSQIRPRKRARRSILFEQPSLYVITAEISNPFYLQILDWLSERKICLHRKR